MNLIAIGLDIAKSIFQVHGVDAHGKSALRKQLRRSEVLRFFAKLVPCLVGIEACHGSHFWGRELTKLGHRVRLLPTQYVKPYLLGGKNDANDAAAICAAVMRPCGCDQRFRATVLAIVASHETAAGAGANGTIASC